MSCGCSDVYDATTDEYDGSSETSCIECIKLRENCTWDCDTPPLCNSCEESIEERNFELELNSKLQLHLQEMINKDKQKQEKKKEAVSKQVTEKTLTKKEQMKQQSRRNKVMCEKIGFFPWFWHDGTIY